jgi:hypothetical protein
MRIDIDYVVTFVLADNMLAIRQSRIPRFADWGEK